MVFNRLGRPLIDLFAAANDHQLVAKRRSGLGSRRSLYSLDKPSCIRLPAGGSHSSNPRQTETISKLQDTTHSSDVAKADMVPETSTIPLRPRVLPTRTDLLSIPGHYNRLPLEDIERIHLTAWPLSSNTSLIEDFRKRLPLSRLKQEGNLPDRLTIPGLHNFSDGVKNARSTPILHLWFTYQTTWQQSSRTKPLLELSEPTEQQLEPSMKV